MGGNITGGKQRRARLSNNPVKECEGSSVFLEGAQVRELKEEVPLFFLS